MYVGVCVCIYACMYVCAYLCRYACMYAEHGVGGGAHGEVVVGPGGVQVVGGGGVLRQWSSGQLSTYAFRGFIVEICPHRMS